MKSRRTIFILIALMLAGTLAWEFSPMEKSAPPTNLPPAKSGVMKAAVEAPKIAPVAPGNSPEPLNPTGPANRGAPSAAADSAPSATIFDLGEVYLANGKPQQFSLDDGTPITITASLAPQGLSLHVEIQQIMLNGTVTKMNVLIGGTADESITVGGMGGIPRIKFIPHVN